jgi:hypothetical protein
MGRILTIVAVAILLPGLLSLSCAKVQLNESTRNEGLLAEIPFRLHGTRIIIEISVDESTPLDFIFDTGAGGNLINARTAAGLGIVGDETVSREGATGMAELVRSADHSVDVGGVKVQDITLGIADIAHIEKQSGMPIDGVIGWLILSRYAVRIDYDAMLIGIYDNDKFYYDFDDSGHPVEVKGTTIFTDITVAFKSGNIFTGQVLFDTGSGNTFSFNSPFTQENDLLAGMDSYYEREIQSLSTVSSHVYTTMLASLNVGDYKLSDVPVRMAIAEAGALSWPGIMGILGNDILKRFNIFIDLQQERMSLEPNRLYDEMFEVNCSGVELVTDDEFQKVIIEHIYPGSPAEEAGLKVGDEIVRINGMNVLDLQLPQVRSMLFKDGREIELLVGRSGELQTCPLMLRALID